MNLRSLGVWAAGLEGGLAGFEDGLAGLDAALRARRRGGRLEIEIGFGKGRYLLARAAASPDTTFVGIEAAAIYWRLTSRQAERRGLDNLITLCGDALYVLGACFDREIADAVHVYFPDPWPKTRHQRRRLLDASTVDLVIGALAPGGTLYFATDHADYGAAVLDVLDRYPAVTVERIEGGWLEGPRTHYETKYEREGRPILRLAVRRSAPSAALLLHPDGIVAVVADESELASRRGDEG